MRKWLIVLILSALSWAEVGTSTHPSIRCQRAGKLLQSLDTAITSFQHPQKGFRVDLVGVVHVGEKAYYQKLNKLFSSYDAVLYELIADDSEGRPIPIGDSEAGADNPLSMVQQGMSSFLGLDFQLKHINYQPNNFVHADVSPQEFQKSMTANNESFLQILMKSLEKGGLENPEAEKELEKVDLLGSIAKGPKPEDRLHLRRALALMFANPEQMSDLLEGQGGKTLVTVRNQKCLNVLKKQLQSGKRKVAIFYGAAHMKDMETQLVKNFGVRYTGTSWLPAWNLEKLK